MKTFVCAAMALGAIGLVGCNATPTAVVVPAPAPTQAGAPTQVVATTAAAVATATLAPTTAPTARPTSPPAATAAPTATPAPTVSFVQLTQGQCCVQPMFSPDGSRVLFLDKPSAAETGIFGVALSQPLSAPTLVTNRLGPFSRDMGYAADLVAGRTVVERLSDGAKWAIQNDGRRVTFAPDNSKIVWSVGEEFGGFDVRRSDIWVADVDGKNAKRIASRFGGGVQGWFPDSRQLLISGKQKRDDKLGWVSVLSLDTGQVRDLFQIERLRGAALSPDGKWMVYAVANARNTESGLFLARADAGPNAAPQLLPFFGSVKWRDADRLLYVPLKQTSPSTELWQFDARTGKSEQLIAASADSPFKIANGDWDVAPDGKSVLYLSARDRNIWLAKLP